MAYSSASSRGSQAHTGSGAGNSYSYADSNAGPTKRGWFDWMWGSGQHSSSSSSSGPGGNFQSSTMTSGPGGTFGTYHSSDDPGRVYTWGNPPPPSYSQYPQEGVGRNGQTVYSDTRSPYGTSNTMTSTSGGGTAHAHSDHSGRSCRIL